MLLKTGIKEFRLHFHTFLPKCKHLDKGKEKKSPDDFVIIPLKTKYPLSQMILVLNRLLRATMFFIHS